jgi:hypothetical protein
MPQPVAFRLSLPLGFLSVDSLHKQAGLYRHRCLADRSVQKKELSESQNRKEDTQ